MAKYRIRKVAALVAVFLLPVCLAVLPTIDRHDAHQRVVVEVMPSTEMATRSAQTQRADEAQEAAMLNRNAAGDHGEVYEK